MARKRKRQSAPANPPADSSIKRETPRANKRARPKQFTHPVLSAYFEPLLTLRDYFVASKSSRLGISDADSDVSALLDSAIVGRSADAASFDVEKELETATQSTGISTPASTHPIPQSEVSLTCGPIARLHPLPRYVLSADQDPF